MPTSQEQVANWNKRFTGSLGVTCCEMTGDTDAVTDAAKLSNAGIICTTPEKFGVSGALTCGHCACGGVYVLGTATTNSQRRHPWTD